jgi:hypothetical protein
MIVQPSRAQFEHEVDRITTRALDRRKSAEAGDA